ncbi:MAG: hypothetical protein KDC39_05625 [Actinobacteria bacterium]|nr:hypothetical protein [Actinomycetota bacterium]
MSLAGSNFGPAEAQLTNVTFFATNDPASYTPSGSGVTVADNPCYTSDTSQSGTVFGFTATATILDDIDVTVAGLYQSGGSSGTAQYCFYGLADASNNDLTALGMGTQVGFIYATYSTTVGNDNVVQGESPTFWGTYDLSPEIANALDNEVTGVTALASMTMNGDTPTGFSLTGEIDTSIYLVGNGSGDEVSLELVSVGINTSVPIGENTGIEASVIASANLTTPAGPNGIQGSLIEMTVTLGVAATTDEGASINVSATVDNTDIQNAFGVSGLTLDTLSFAGSIGFEGDEVKYDVALGAVVGLPASITDPIGMVAGTPVGFTLSVGDDNPCFQFSIGEPTDTTSVINWGQIIEADYINLVIAPLGNCTFGTVTYNDTFQLDFDGTLLDTPTQITAAFELEDGFSMNANVDISSFNLAGMSVQQTTVNLVIGGTDTTDTSSSQMTVTFSGGANLFGSVVVQVNGSMQVNLLTSNPSLDLQLNGNVTGNLLGIFNADASLALTADMAVTSGSFSVSQLDFTVTAGFQLLVLTGNGSLDFNYSDGAVQSISGNASIDLNLWIANISGSASFSYSNGDPNITVSATGSLTVGFWIFTTTIDISKTFTIPASNITTSEYTPPPAQTIPVAAPSATSNSWPLTYNFYQYFDFNLGASYTNTQDENLNYWYDILSTYNLTIEPYSSTFGEDLAVQSQSPTIAGGSVSWLGDGWPTGYDALLTSWYDNLDVTANIQGTSTTLGQAADGSDSTNNVEVTVTLPTSPFAQFSILTYPQNIYDGGYGLDTGCNSTTTRTITIPIPNWVNALDSPDANWTWIMMDINYRLWLAGVSEKLSIAEVNSTNSFGPDWGTNENFDIPGGLSNNTGYAGYTGCGYNMLDDSSVSLYDLVTSTGVPAVADSVLPTYYNLSSDDSVMSTNLPGFDYSSVSGMVGNLPVPSPAQYFDEQYSGGCPLTSTYVEPGHWQLNWIGCTADNLGTSPPYTTMDNFFVPLGWQSNWRPATDQTGAWWGSYSQSGSPYSMNTTVTESADGEDWSVTNLISIYFPVPS